MSKKRQDVEVHEAGEIGTFMVRGTENGESRIIAEMAFQWDGPVMKLLHTAVRPGHEDKGLALLLVETAVQRARDEDFQINPVCPYAQKIFDDQEETIGDVRA